MSASALKRKDPPEGEDAGTQSKQSMTLKRMWETGEWSDLEVRAQDCGGKSKTFRVHKAVICPASKFFHDACLPDANGRRPDSIEVQTHLKAMEAVLKSFYEYEVTIDDLSKWPNVAGTNHAAYSLLCLDFHATEYGSVELGERIENLFAIHLDELPLLQVMTVG